jgi:hypothetical protein
MYSFNHAAFRNFSTKMSGFLGRRFFVPKKIFTPPKIFLDRLF